MLARHLSKETGMFAAPLLLALASAAPVPPVFPVSPSQVEVIGSVEHAQGKFGTKKRGKRPATLPTVR
jgi:hypothetical protein